MVFDNLPNGTTYGVGEDMALDSADKNGYEVTVPDGAIDKPGDIVLKPAPVKAVRRAIARAADNSADIVKQVEGTIEGVKDDDINENVKQFVSFTNKRGAASLEISKKVVGDEASDEFLNREWKFTLKLTAPDGNPLTAASGGWSAENKWMDYTHIFVGEAAGRTLDTFDAETGMFTFYLKSGESIKFDRLPDGTQYEVAEVDKNAPGYETTVESAPELSGTVNGEKSPVLTFAYTNRWKTGSLTVNKSMGGEAQAGETVTFKIDLDLSEVELIKNDMITADTLIAWISSSSYVNFEKEFDAEGNETEIGRAHD